MLLVLARIVGIAISAVGIVFAVRPDWMIRVGTFWQQGKNGYAAAAIRIVFGFILILAVPRARDGALLFTFSIALLVSGAVIFPLGLDRFRSAVNLWKESPALAQRILAGFAGFIGAMIVYAA